MTENNGVNAGSVPRLALGAVLRHDESRDQELLLMPERVIKLNGSGAAILSLCDGQCSVADIGRELGRRFGVQGLEGDIIEFLADLAGRGWVRV